MIFALTKLRISGWLFALTHLPQPNLYFATRQWLGCGHPHLQYAHYSDGACTLSCIFRVWAE